MALMLPLNLHILNNTCGLFRMNRADFIPLCAKTIPKSTLKHIWANARKNLKIDYSKGE